MAKASDAAAELVLYPGEGPGFLGAGVPYCRFDATSRIVRWLEAPVNKVNDPLQPRNCHGHAFYDPFVDPGTR